MSQLFNWDTIHKVQLKHYNYLNFKFYLIYLVLLLAYYFKEEVEMEIINN
jgi:hypothetical protein